MKLSRFFAATNREVMRQVRLALGPDALIVSSRRVNGGVEIVAADQTAAFAEQATQEVRTSAKAQGSAQVDSSFLKALDSVRGELLERFDELSWAGRLREEPGGLSVVFQHLLGCGFSTSLLRSILSNLPSNVVGTAALRWASDALLARLPTVNAEDSLLVPGAVLALVGPTGVGKTTTVAKLAARCAARVGARSLALITTDTYRIGAYDQLKQYGQMLQVPVGVAKSPEQLASMLEAVPSDHIVLIDNTGVSQRDPRVEAQTGMLMQMPRKVRRLLVLDAASHGDTLDEVARSYAADQQQKPIACIITKTDEAIRLAPALDVAMRYQLPVQYLSDGQRVPQDLAQPDAPTLIERALDKPPGSQFLYAASQAEFVALAAAAEKASTVSLGLAVRPPRQLLPRLLSSATLGKNLEPLAQALQHIGLDNICQQAYEQWCHRYASSGAAAACFTAEREQLAAALTLSATNRIWVVHDTLSLRHEAARQRLPAVLAFDETGVAIGASMLPQQAAPLRRGPHGRLKDSPTSRLEALPLLGKQGKVIHLFGRTGPPGLRQLAKCNATWLALCSGKLMLRSGGFRMPVSALAKTLSYTRVTLDAFRTTLSRVHGRSIDGVLIDAAVTRAQIEQKGQPPLPLTVYVLQIVCRTDPTFVQTIYALGAASDANYSIEDWAYGLLLQSEARDALRKAAGFWPALCEDRSQFRANEANDIRFALQTGFALWSIEQLPGHSDTRAALVALCGKPSPTKRRLGRALLQLFAIRQLDEPAEAV